MPKRRYAVSAGQCWSVVSADRTWSVLSTGLTIDAVVAGFTGPCWLMLVNGCFLLVYRVSTEQS